MESIESFGKIEWLCLPCVLHKADAAVWKKRYPFAKLLTPKSALQKIEKATHPGEMIAVEDVERELAAQGVTVLPIGGVKSEFLYLLSVAPGKVCLLTCDLAHNHAANDAHVKAFAGAQKFLFGVGPQVIRAAQLPAIGFIKDKKACQQTLFEICDTHDPRLGATSHLVAIVFTHGPPVWSGADTSRAPYTDPLWVLRYPIACGPFLPPSAQACSDRTVHQLDAAVKVGFLDKSDPKLANWKTRLCVLTADGRITYREGTVAKNTVKGFVDLQGCSADPGPGADKKHPFLFTVAYPAEPDRRVFTFNASSAAERDDWLQAIKRVVGESAGGGGGGHTSGPANAVQNLGDEAEPPEDHGYQSAHPEYGPVLNYWFYQVNSDSVPLTYDHVVFWFFANGAVDQQIGEAFGGLLEQARAGALAHWEQSVEGVVALVILLDQFTRNVYRRTGDEFSSDRLVRQVVDRARAKGLDQQAPLFQRIWLYLVYQREESREAAAQWIQFYPAMVAEARAKHPANVWFYEQALKRATEQKEILDRFGRFPVRNAVLRRESTADEQAYLRSPDQYFSTGVSQRTALAAAAAGHSPLGGPRLQLTYFDFGGRAEPVRIAFHLTNTAFEDRRLAPPDFFQQKNQGVFLYGTVPQLAVDGTAFAESGAILRYAARLGDGSLYPQDPRLALAADGLVDALDVIHGTVGKTAVIRDPAERLAARQQLIAPGGPWHVALTGAERFLREGQFTDTEHLVSNSLTTCDLKLLVIAKDIRQGFFDGVPTDYLVQFPLLDKAATAVENHPRIKEYYASKKK